MLNQKPAEAVKLSALSALVIIRNILSLIITFSVPIILQPN